ncbi:MAG: DUF6629 family protein [Bacteroidota bacterium]
MCFSATASFGASAVLGSIGIVAIIKSKTNSQRLFATIPLLFSVQQLSEGMLWLSLKDQGMAPWQDLLTSIYLVFAMAVWPLWIPLTIRLLEKNSKRKKIMNGLVVTGALVTFAVCWVLYRYPVMVMPMHHHLHYEFGIPEAIKKLIAAFSVLYILATIITPFVSSINKMKWLGIVFLLSYLFAVIFYRGFVVSVWCFFAAMLSFVVLWIILGLRKRL